LLVTAGYIAAKWQYLNQTTISQLSKLTFSYIIPAFLFHSMATANFTDMLAPEIFISFYGAVISCFLLCFFIYRRYSSIATNADSALFSLSACYSNTMIIGLPILIAAYGDKAIAIIFLIMSFHSAVLFFITGFGCSITTNQGFKPIQLIKSSLFNPLIIAIFLGFIINLMSLQLPIWLNNTLLLIGKPAITLALFILGTSLTIHRVSDNINAVLLASLVKLILLPALVWLLASQLFQLSPLLTAIVVILTACPTGVNAYLVACNYQSQQSLVAGTVVSTTVLSTITLPIWLYLLQ
jgi:hypothetical protein